MTCMPNQDEPSGGRPECRRCGQPLWFWAVLAAMLAAFGVVLLERDVIRSYWWANRLAQCDDLKQQSYYINALLNVGDDASGAVHGMMVDSRARVRAAAVLILAQGDSPSQVADLAGMLADGDREVRESAARTLAFLDRPEAEKALTDAVRSDNTAVAAAAAAGLSRLDSADAICALCRAIAEHPGSLVRAQAVESLGAVLMSSADALEVANGGGCDPISALVTALCDRGGFYGTLSLECEINAARSAAVIGNASAIRRAVREMPPSSTPFYVSHVARRAIAALLGEPFETPMPTTPQAAAELADSLRRRIADNAIRIGLPASMPTLPTDRR